MLYEVRYYQNCKSVWDELERHLDKEIADYGTFCRGEQVILLESNLEVDWEDSGKHKYETMDTTLKPGDTITIQTKGKAVSAVIAGVMSAEEMDLFEGGASYILLGSETLGRRVAAEEQQEYGYNQMKIRFNTLADSEATGKIIARQCVRNSLDYDSYFEDIQAAFHKVIQVALVYGTLAVIIFILYTFVLSCILQEENRKRQKKLEALHQLGASWEQLQKARIRSGRMDAAYLLMAVPAAYAIWGFRMNADWSYNTEGYFSNFFHRWIYEMTQKKYVFYTLLDAMNLVWLLFFMFVACGIVFLLHMKKSNDEG